MTNEELYTPTINQIVLEKIRRRIQHRVSNTFLKWVQYTEIRERVWDEILYQLDYELFGIRREVKKEIKRPKNWREAIKERFFPNWLLKKFPVEYETIPVAVEVCKMCPHLNVTDYREHIAWLAADRVHDSDWQSDKSIPFWLKQTSDWLSHAADLLEYEHSLFAGNLREQAEKLKEIV